jgi:hypothetical protein
MLVCPPTPAITQLDRLTLLPVLPAAAPPTPLLLLLSNNTTPGATAAGSSTPLLPMLWLRLAVTLVCARPASVVKTASAPTMSPPCTAVCLLAPAPASWLPTFLPAKALLLGCAAGNCKLLLPALPEQPPTVTGWLHVELASSGCCCCCCRSNPVLLLLLPMWRCPSD